MKRKLKKLEQILAESPGWGVNRRGFIEHRLWSTKIAPEMIKDFGQIGNFSDVDGEDNLIYNGQWNWDKSWFEQPVKKKLYAYMDNISQEVRFSAIETSTWANDKRAPEWDIEYGDE